jgi:hypothetical protein
MHLFILMASKAEFLISKKVQVFALKHKTYFLDLSKSHLVLEYAYYMINICSLFVQANEPLRDL